ncbi:MAG: MBOAT family O-acyltransferase [Bacteroidota bacterium]
MAFSSITFLLFFLPTLLVIYFALPHKYKNYFLLLSSIFFYSWGAPLFIFVILLTTAFDFFLVNWMDKQQSDVARKYILMFSVCINVGLLFYFKYCNFFIENINETLQLFSIQPIKWLKVVLPIGISFYTFESLTYVIDVYRKEHKPLNNFLNYQLYIILFPKLIAGPIIRYSEIADQITGRFASYSIDQILGGFYRFIIGLSKKVLIANTVGVIADNTFNLPAESLSASSTWIGMFAYTFQIYFDFSGYSDMAIGIGQMLGFRFPENFNNPYTSTSITDFWRKWHMTLGSWMKNYLYIPLGGSKVSSKWKLYFNLWIVFILSGFWHGASWSFIVWGIFHGFFLVLERIGWSKILVRLGTIPSTLITFLIVSVGWVFFRSDSLAYALSFIKKLFCFENTDVWFNYSNDFIFMFFLAIIFSFFVIIPGFKKIQNFVYSEGHSFVSSIGFTIVSLILLGISISFITTSDFNPFIYFRF